MSNLVSKEYLEIIELPALEDYTHWQFLQERKIIINNVIDDSVVEKALMQVLKINNDDKHIPIEQRKPIVIYLNTPGGLVYIGMALCDAIRQSKTPVHIHALGYACSMGSLILACGHKRIAYENTVVMIHEGGISFEGNAGQAKDLMEFNKITEKRAKKIILDNTKITEEKYDSMTRKDWWMYADEALELGIIDEIIGMEGVNK